MAYSDYGGYAFKGGKRVEERSDYTIRPDGSGFGTPGSYPGFAAIAAGASGDEVQQIARMPHHHVVLGDGPIFVGLHKQLSVHVYRNGEELDDCDFLIPECRDGIKTWAHEGKSSRYLDTDSFVDKRPAIFEIDGHRLEVHFREEDNYYQYAKLVQPDGQTWFGWAGYGVGAGLEDCGYGFSTEDRNETLRSIWPESISAAA